MRELREWIELIKREGEISILLAEQNALFALHLADRGYILEKGRIQQEGPAAALSGSAEARRHLGVQDKGAPARGQRPGQRPADGEAPSPTGL